MESDVFFWIAGLNEPIVAPIEDLTGDFKLVHSSHSLKQWVGVFYEPSGKPARYSKLRYFIWNPSTQSLDFQNFSFPDLPQLSSQDWRSFLMNYSIASSSTSNRCQELYKNDSGANFDNESLLLIDLTQEVQGKPLNEAVFDLSTDELEIKVNRYQPQEINNQCAIGDPVQTKTVISNLRILPDGSLPSTKEFVFEKLSILAYSPDQ